MYDIFTARLLITEIEGCRLYLESMSLLRSLSILRATKGERLMGFVFFDGSIVIRVCLVLLWHFQGRNLFAS